MSEWVSVFGVFWVLWALDGVRLGPRRIFTWVGSGWRRGRARVGFSRVSLPGVWPASWRVTGADVPLAWSPLGVSNRPFGGAGRPAEPGGGIKSWRWDEVREVGLARGWIYVNGARFCPDTGHVRASELLELARMKPEQREAQLRRVMRRWFRPTHVARRARVLRGRTGLAAKLNTTALLAWVALTIYVAGDLASKLPSDWSERLVQLLPIALVGLLALHVAAVVAAGRAVRRLKAVRPEKRGSTLFSALLLPPQAMRLRTLAGDGFFPPQHPLAMALALSDGRARDELVFHVLTDLRWPIGATDETPAGREIAEWHRGALERQITATLAAAAFDAQRLLAAPLPDAPASGSYCPRCGAQFVAADGLCPNGVPLRSLNRGGSDGETPGAKHPSLPTARSRS